MITHDLHCIECGYNLRMLEEGGRCPECGTYVASTLAAAPTAIVIAAQAKDCLTIAGGLLGVGIAAAWPDTAWALLAIPAAICIVVGGIRISQADQDRYRWSRRKFITHLCLWLVVAIPSLSVLLHEVFWQSRRAGYVLGGTWLICAVVGVDLIFGWMRRRAGEMLGQLVLAQVFAVRAAFALSLIGTCLGAPPMEEMVGYWWSRRLWDVAPWSLAAAASWATLVSLEIGRRLSRRARRLGGGVESPVN